MPHFHALIAEAYSHVGQHWSTLLPTRLFHKLTATALCQVNDNKLVSFLTRSLSRTFAHFILKLRGRIPSHSFLGTSCVS
uniref:Uncharacterized protein n=1 Tax=Physcomitrium patens TaxID=3218 RepID=A0A2K1JZU2_PHYPA|nr:hypothetical protein PHYPA_014167 [Physcomitrium patens]